MVHQCTEAEAEVEVKEEIEAEEKAEADQEWVIQGHGIIYQ